MIDICAVKQIPVTYKVTVFFYLLNTVERMLRFIS